MITQMVPFCNEHPTSQAAGRQIQPLAATLRQQVLDYLRGRGRQGATDAEMQAALQMAGNTQRPRRQELQKMGLVHDSFTRRPVPSGRLAIVWKAD